MLALNTTPAGDTEVAEFFADDDFLATEARENDAYAEYLADWEAAHNDGLWFPETFAEWARERGF